MAAEARDADHLLRMSEFRSRVAEIEEEGRTEIHLPARTQAGMVASRDLHPTRNSPAHA
jgi:hypothetical protein